MKSIKKVIFIFFVVLVFSFTAEAKKSITFDEIKVEGLKRTSRDVVLTELSFVEGQKVTRAEVEHGVNEVRNTDLFAKVEHKLVKRGGKKVLLIKVKERWTTIPIFKVASGGGISQLTLGVFDPNVFGKYVELGGQYEKLGAANSGVLWFKNPRLFNTKYGVDLQFWKTNRIRTKYVVDAEGPIIQTGFLQKRDRLFFGLNKEFTSSKILKVFYEYNKDSFSDEFIADEVKLALSAAGGLPPSSEFHFLGAGFELGLLNINNYLVDGKLLELTYRYGLSQVPGQADFGQVDASFRYMKTLFKKSTFAQRLLFGANNTTILQHRYYLGGLDRVRGFSDNRFSGQYFWLSNSEFRYPFYENKWLVLQSVAFFDLVANAEKFSELAEFGAVSAGAGLRIFLPKVYRFVVRFDYATPLKKNDDMNFSFGVQQFF